MPRLHDHDKAMISWAGGDSEDLASWLQRDYDYEKLLSLMRPRAGMQLLDIGCGNGEVLAAAELFNIQSVGIETAPEAAAVSKKNAPYAKIVVGSPQEIPFDDEQFDLVTCFGVMDFFSNPCGGMREIHRVLKYGGRTCIVLPNADYAGLKRETRFDYSELEVFYPLDTWETMMKATGLFLTDIRFSFPGHHYKNEQLSGLGRYIKNLFYPALKKFFPKTFASQFICICRKRPSETD